MLFGDLRGAENMFKIGLITFSFEDLRMKYMAFVNAAVLFMDLIVLGAKR